MRATFFGRALIAGTALVFLSGVRAAGQTEPVDLAGLDQRSEADHFGGGVGMTVVPARLFAGLPAAESDGFSYVTYTFPGVNAWGWAPLDLPNGAEITQICGVVYDYIQCGGAGVRLLGWEYPNATGGATTPVQTLANAGSDWGAFPG